MPTSTEYQNLWRMIKPLKCAMLSTHHRGRIHSRPMALVQEQFDGTLYFFTQDDSLKVAEVNEEQEVGISFSIPEKQIFLSLSGDARLNKDPALIRDLWNDQLESYFPEGQSDPHLALLEIKIDNAQVWSRAENQMVELFAVSHELFKDNPPDVGDYRRYA